MAKAGTVGQRSRLLRHAAVLRRRAGRLDPTVRGLLWAAAAGVLFSMLNALLRRLTIELNPSQAQFLRHVAGLLVMFPLVLRSGLAAWRPKDIGAQFTRGALYTVGLMLWFAAVPHIPLAETTAIGFTAPLFVMLGAVLLLGEPMRRERWMATAMGMAGVLVVVGPRLTGSGGVYLLMMLGSAVVFAASFLLTKTLTRTERTEVIVLWLSVTIGLFSLPLAVLNWEPLTPGHALAFLLCGVLGTVGHYCMTHSMTVADLSATQSAKFLDLVWATLLGWSMFGDLPSRSTLLGGAVICASTLWLAHRESRSRA